MGIGQRFEISKKLEFPPVESLLEVAEEFLAEQTRKDPNGQKESLSARDPPAVVRGQSACGNDTVQVRVMQQGLRPSVQNGKEAESSSEVFRVGSDGAEAFRGCPEEDGVDDTLVLKSHRRNFIGNGKDDVIVGNGKQLGHARLEPLRLGERLALGTVAVAAGVVGDPLGAALIAHVEVAA